MPFPLSCELDQLVALGLHDDLAQDEVRRRVDGLKDEVGGRRNGDHFIALNCHLDVVPERRVHSAKVEEAESDSAALVFLSEAFDHAGNRVFAGDVGRGIAHGGLS